MMLTNHFQPSNDQILSKTTLQHIELINDKSYLFMIMNIIGKMLRWLVYLNGKVEGKISN